MIALKDQQLDQSRLQEPELSHLELGNSKQHSYNRGRPELEESSPEQG